MIDRSLNEVRIGAGMTMQRRVFSLNHFIGEIKYSAQLEAELNGCALLVEPVDPLLFISADCGLLFSALGNLLQNVFKFSAIGAPVTLYAYALGERIRIDVRDRCGGLPAGFSDTAFEPVTQAGTNREGLGLGLSIAHAVLTRTTAGCRSSACRASAAYSLLTCRVASSCSPITHRKITVYSWLPCQESISGLALFEAVEITDGALSAPTMIGTTTNVSSAISNDAFTWRVFRPLTAEPITQVPKPMAQAASIRFSAASQQSAATKTPADLAQIRISVSAS